MQSLNKAAVRFLVVHCSATPPDQDIGVEEIRKWHKATGWDDVGYHYVVRRDGTIEAGRSLDFQGAHVEGHNHESLGICLVGGVKRTPDADGKDDIDGPRWDLIPDANFTAAQYTSLEHLINLLLPRYPGAVVRGHRDFPGVGKACPSFDAPAWWSQRSELAA
jgi:N-acetylmuramoyl-L-alanine amidase